jgi:hypothetical protein
MKHDTMKYLLATLFLWIGCSLSATATEKEAGSDKNEKAALGTRTSQWLDIQREGRAAGNMLTIPGAEAGPSYQRYMDSFAKPIPDQLLSETPASGGKK